MTLYSYIWPVSFYKSNNKCIIYKNNDVIYCGNIGEIPMKYGELLFIKVILNGNALKIYVKDNKEKKYEFG